jgi:hypothetical protein
MYTSAAISTPPKVATATLRPGFSTTALATEALSSPVKAQNSSTSDCGMTCIAGSWRTFHDCHRTALPSKYHQPPLATSRIGTRPMTIASDSTWHTSRGPRILTAVSSQMRPAVPQRRRAAAGQRRHEVRQIADRRHRNRDVADPARQPVERIGLKAEIGTQRFAGVGARTAGCGATWLSLARTMAISSAPTVPIAQPITVMLPTAASVAGSRKMPEPIMLLATSAVASTGPILRLRIAMP